MTEKNAESETKTKRTRVKDLPKPDRELHSEEMAEVKGGAVGPCFKPRSVVRQEGKLLPTSDDEVSDVARSVRGGGVPG